MNTIFRSGLILSLLIAGASGCSSIEPTGRTVSPYSEGAITTIPPASPSRPSPAGLDDYKIQVAQHLLQHNPERSFSGTLPPMLPAIVVLSITVDRDGQLTDVKVQRSRDDDASQIALASLRRSLPLPPPHELAQAGGKLTFSETFLFADSVRYQLRSLAGPQAAE
jgi:periplasmic protein TonB